MTGWLQHDVRDGLFVHSAWNDAEWFENFWNWLRKHVNAFLMHDVLFHQLGGWEWCFWRRIHLPQMLSGQQMNSEVLLVWTSLRSTLSSFSKHMCMRFSTTTPTETSFFRAAFYFWKLWECFEMFLDVLEFVRTMRLRRRWFWTYLKVNSNKLNSHNMVMKSLWETVLLCACRRCHFNSTEQLKQEKTNICMLHVQDNLAGQTACFLCVSCVEKGIEGIAVKPSWIWVVFGFRRSTRS